LIDILIRNKPAQRYLCIKTCSFLGTYSAANTLVYYVKSVAAFENATLWLSIIAAASMFVLPIAFNMVGFWLQYCSPAQTFGIMAVYIGMSELLLGIDARFIYIHALPVGCTSVIENAILDGLLSEVIDYDELRYGVRREGSFVLINSALSQVLDIIMGVAPGILLTMMGYVGGGGCSCGCGVGCTDPYKRWDCPTDIGYACSSALGDGNPPFFGDTSRKPTCTMQNPATYATINILYAFLPCVLHCTAGYFAYYHAPLSRNALELVRQQLELAKTGNRKVNSVFDPTTHELVGRATEAQEEALSALNYFTKSEVSSLLDAKSNIVAQMLVKLRKRRFISICLVASGIVFIVKAIGTDSFMPIVTGSMFLILGSGVMYAVDSARSTALRDHGSLLRYYCNLFHFETQFREDASKSWGGRGAAALLER